VKAYGAAVAALGFVFKPLDAFEPIVAVVVGVDEGNAVLFGKADVFVFANLVLAVGMNIGVVKVNGVIDARCGHGLHDFAGTGCAARVQQHLFAVIGQRESGALKVGHGK